MTTDGPSNRLRVVEVAQGIAGPACGRLFAALGHDVVKCEPPGGDYLRRQPPLGAQGDGLAFTTLNAGKDSIVLDSTDSARLDPLIDRADVLIIDLPPVAAQARGLSPNRLRLRWPNLVTVSVTGFGQHGEYAETPADSLLAEAYGGLSTMIGDANRKPLSLGGEQCAYAAAFTAFLGAMLALRRRDRQLGGDFIDVAMCDVAAYMDWKSDVALAMTGEVPRRGAARDDAWQITRAMDGWVGVIFQNQHWPAVVEMVDVDALRDPELRDERIRLARRDEWWPHLANWIAARPARDVYDDARQRGLPFGWVMTIRDLVESPQLRERDFIDVDGPAAGRPAVKSPVRCTGLPWRAGTPPRLGARRTPWSEGGQPWSERARQSDPDGTPGADAGRTDPLAGLTVLDFGTITAGAAVTRLLADYGATVIKIEWRGRPDTFRTWKMPAGAGEPGQPSPYFPANNVGKLGVAIDLKTPQGRELVHRLAAASDVLVENFRVDVTRRLGVDFDTIHRINPKLLYLSLSSQGQQGPESLNSSFGSTLDLLSGLASLTGYTPEEPIWSSSEVNYPDQLVSLFGAALVAYCLQVGLVGQHLDVSQREVVTWTLGAEIAEYLVHQTVTRANGNRRSGATPHDVYPGAAPDTWIAVACLTDDHRAALARCLDRHDLEGRDAAWWWENQDLVDEWVAAWTSTRHRDDGVAMLRQHGVPAVPVLTAADRAARRRFTDRLVSLTQGRYPLKGFPILFDRYRPPPPRGAPEIGEHTLDVLSRLAGMSRDEIDKLEAAGVVHLADSPGRPHADARAQRI